MELQEGFSSIQEEVTVFSTSIASPGVEMGVMLVELVEGRKISQGLFLIACLGMLIGSIGLVFSSSGDEAMVLLTSIEDDPHEEMGLIFSTRSKI